MFGFKREPMFDLGPDQRVKSDETPKLNFYHSMKYVGLHTQIRRNNLKSSLLLVLFPAIIFLLVWLFIYFTLEQPDVRFYYTNRTFLSVVPWISVAILTWFLIAFFFHTGMIRKASGSVALERKDNKRVYNLVENLCISTGMKMPNINLIEDDSLNAFASGINTSNYTVSLSRGIIDKLDDDELEAVIAHELTHIRNRDVRLLIVSIPLQRLNWITSILQRVVSRKYDPGLFRSIPR